jgi:hypothetical protein
MNDIDNKKRVELDSKNKNAGGELVEGVHS